MATEIIVKRWCDPCLKRADGPGERREAVYNEVVVLPSGEALMPSPTLIALCESHFQELLVPLARAVELGDQDAPEVAASGLPRPKARRAGTAPPANGSSALLVDGGTTCAECGHIVSTRGGLDYHMRAKHGMTLSAYENPGEDTTGPAQCPDCDAPPFVGKQGLATHRRWRHRDQAAASAR